ncbi:hypothetical protein HMF7854_12495 [Sphingomonas ginkgonis]|uniref:Flagellar FliJ protein n=1 Tax=Sphingomonas ginkgonis TaxID=2315330 RepID=A0A429VCG1_9SPHN|nr:hypothetical protein [Sphingomonas ginkgonis]RST31566.1 hypothetical protein HMF7854_12495 [Sphingomonas ginkgonis]
MSRLSQRCARVLRVRAVEHRVATVRQLAAERRIAELLGVARRLEDLRAGLDPVVGTSSGQSLRAMAEMKARLVRAERELSHPIRDAEAHHEQAAAARLAARTREDGAERLRDKAAAGEESAAALRADADRPARFVKRRRA